MWLPQLSMLGFSRYGLFLILVALLIAFRKNVVTNKDIFYNFGFAVYLLGAVVSTMGTMSLASIQYILIFLISYWMYNSIFKYGIKGSHIRSLCVFFILTMCVPIYDDGMYTSIYFNSNTLGSVALVTTYLILLSYDKKPFLKALLIAICLLFLYISESRGQLGACLALLSFSFAFVRFPIVRKQYRKISFIVCASIITVYVVLIEFQYGVMLDLILQFSPERKQFVLLSYRDILYFASKEIISEYPLGVGFGNSGEYIAEYMNGEKLSPHNAFLKIFVEGGWIAIIGYLILLLNWIAKSKSPLSSAFVIAIVIRSLVESATPYGASLVSMAMILPYLLTENQIKEKEPVMRQRQNFFDMNT